MKKRSHYKFLFLLILPSFCGYSQSWIQQSSNSSNDFNTIFATSNSRVHAFGDSSDIFGGFALGSHYATSNQGFSWGYSSLNSIVYTSRESYFVDNNVGYLVGKNQLSGNGFVLKTVDGGSNWVEDVPHVERLEAVHFENANFGYATGRNDYVVRTVDGGVNWVDVSSNTGDHIMGVSFTNPSNGFIVGRAGNIAHTTDSASTWVNQTSATPEDLEGVWFVNDSTGWAVGTAGTIVHTSDSGITWVNQTSNTPEDLFDVEFVNDSTGWAVGAAGAIVMTTDAGVTWSVENSNTTEDIFSITMRNESLGWFCGTNGTIFIYAVSPPNQIDESYSIETTLYPVPADNSLNVRFESYQIDIRLKMISITGQTIYESSFSGIQLKLNTADFPSGTYVLQSLDHGNVVSKSFVVLH